MSQQKKKAPCKREIPAAKEKCPQQKRNNSGQKKKTRGKET